MAIKNGKVKLDLDFNRIEELTPMGYKLGEALLPLGILGATVGGIVYIAQTSSFSLGAVFFGSMSLAMFSIYFLEKLIFAIKEAGFNAGLTRYLVESGKDKEFIKMLREEEEKDKNGEK